MSLEDFIEEHVVNADHDPCESDVDRVAREEDVAAARAELKALREQVKTARERALDEVAAYLRAESNRYLGADEHHERAEAFHIAAEEVAAGQLRTTSADPELARLEREVARAAVAFAHIIYVTLNDTKDPRWRKANDESADSSAALWKYLAAKREGGAK